jgi:hypothetical protein
MVAAAILAPGMVAGVRASSTITSVGQRAVALAQTLIQNGKAAGGIHQSGNFTTAPITPPDLPGRLVTYAQDPADFNLPGASSWDIQNGWIGSIGYTSIAVMGGAEPSDPTKGMIVVAYTDLKTAAQAIRFVATNTSGPVTITGESSGTISFTAPSGQTGTLALSTIVP